MEDEVFKVVVEEVERERRPRLGKAAKNPLIDEAVRRRLNERYTVPVAAFMSSI